MLNRITFSGTIKEGGYSNDAFVGRFTHSLIERVRQLTSHQQTHGYIGY